MFLIYMFGGGGLKLFSKTFFPWVCAQAVSAFLRSRKFCCDADLFFNCFTFHVFFSQFELNPFETNLKVLVDIFFVLRTRLQMAIEWL